MFLCLQVPTNPIAHQVFCVCVGVCVSICVQQWDWWPTCYRCHPDHGVMCERRCVCVCVRLCMLCLITEDGVVDSLFWLLWPCSGWQIVYQHSRSVCTHTTNKLAACTSWMCTGLKFRRGRGQWFLDHDPADKIRSGY